RRDPARDPGHIRDPAARPGAGRERGRSAREDGTRRIDGGVRARALTPWDAASAPPPYRRPMARVNEHYRKLQAGYLFPEIGRRVRAFSEAHPEARVIRLGIGDVTLPLAPAIVEAMRDAVIEMGTASGFRGYGPDNGYDFL